MAQMLFDTLYRAYRMEESDSILGDNTRYYVSFRPSDESSELATAFVIAVEDPKRFEIGKDYRLMLATKDE